MKKGLIHILIVCLLTFNCSALADNLTTEILPMDIGVYNGETKLEVPTYSDGTTVYVPLEKLIQMLGGSYEVQGENIVLSIASETDSQSTVSDDADTISSIKNVVLFDKDGVKAYFTGKFQEDNMLHLEVIIENQTNKNLEITYTGKANGWNLGSDYTIGNAYTVHSDSKAKGDLWFLPEQIGASTCLDIESLDLVFKVIDADTYIVIFTVETGSIDLKNGAATVQPTDYVEKDDNDGGSLGSGKDMLMSAGNCAVYDESSSTYTADELAYVAYKDIDRAYFSCLNYMKHMDRLWSSLLNINTIDEIDDDWMFGSYLFGSNDQTELFQRYNFLSTIAKRKLGMDEDMSFSDHIKATGRNIVIDAIQESASTNALADPRDVMWLLLAWGEETGCMTSMAEIELCLQYAKDEIEAIMNEDSNYANTATLQEYYAETSALYSYLNDFMDTYPNFVNQKKQYEVNSDTWEFEFDAIFGKDAYSTYYDSYTRFIEERKAQVQ